MIEPVILTDAILTQAGLWAAECQRRSPVPPNAPPIGEAVFTSPVDGSERRVTLRVASMAVKGKTVRGIFADTGARIGTGYTIALDTDYVEIAPGKIIHVLLHEVIHSLDPRFDEDEDWQEQNGRMTDKLELYRLTSERRAFSCMWIEALRSDLTQQRYSDPNDAIVRYTHMLPEFSHFCAYNTDEMDHIRAAISAIVQNIQRRQSSIAKGDGC